MEHCQSQYQRGVPTPEDLTDKRCDDAHCGDLCPDMLIYKVVKCTAPIPDGCDPRGNQDSNRRQTKAREKKTMLVTKVVSKEVGGEHKE